MQINQVLKSKISEHRIRIIAIAPDWYQVIDVDDPNAWPVRISEADLADYDIIADPFPLPNVEAGSIAEKRRDEAYHIIKPLLDQHVRLFEKKERNQLIKDLQDNLEKPRIYITRALRRFWQRGMSPNALAPDYQNCGGKGKSRRGVTSKLGRKRKLSPGTGMVITEEISEIFRSAIELYYLVGKKVPLKEAMTKANGLIRTRYPALGPADLPTAGQFYYFYRINYLKHESEKQRLPSRIYNKDLSPLISTATAYNFGPGARYEIDATIADIYLVSEKDPERIVGRPTIYLVKDVFSRMIVGMYVGYENASWVTACIALANSFSNKVNYCKLFGITITDEQWPSYGIPASIFADRGELLSRQADALTNRFAVQISNSRAYRGDDKGICERHFNTIQAEFKPYVSGVVEPVNGKKRNGKRYELDAELSLSAFTEIMIRLVVRHNTTHVIEGYDFAPDMPDDLPAVPIELWKWGVKNRTGKLRSCDDKLAFINLLPHEKATISESGIKLRKLIYTCKEALKAGWFDRIRQNRPSEVEVAFDPRNTNLVYLRQDNSFENYWVCDLSDRSRSLRDMTFAEAGQFLVNKRKTETSAKQVEAFLAPDTQSIVESIAERERKKKPSVSTQTASERLRGIRDNRRDELGEERKRSEILKPSKPNSDAKASVIDIRTRLETNASLDYPDLDQFLEDNDD